MRALVHTAFLTLVFLCLGANATQCQQLEVTPSQMLRRLRLRVFCVLCYVSVIVALQSPIFGQLVAQRDREATIISRPAQQPAADVLSQLPQDEAAKVASSSIPVLVIPNINAFDEARLIVKEMYYSAYFRDQNHSISIQGSRWSTSYAHVVPSPNLTSKTIRSTQGFVTESDAIWTASWNEFGAAYFVSVECARRLDIRCRSERYVTDLTNSLVYVGGGQLTTSELLTQDQAFRALVLVPELIENLAQGLGDIVAPPPTDFRYLPAGRLLPRSGRGRRDLTVYAPGIRFPIESKPAFANSQVWNPGGNHGGNGTQCNSRNYSYPWRDNFCESRARGTPMCPSGKGHQGQDIRPSSCRKNTHFVVSVSEGTVTHIGPYSVFITAPDGTQFRYLHMSNVAVRVGERVAKGARIGQVSNVFNNTPTTIHLHFEIVQNVRGFGLVHVPPYTSLVEAYQRLP